MFVVCWILDRVIMTLIKGDFFETKQIAWCVLYSVQSTFDEFTQLCPTIKLHALNCRRSNLEWEIFFEKVVLIRLTATLLYNEWDTRATVRSFLHRVFSGYYNSGWLILQVVGCVSERRVWNHVKHERHDCSNFIETSIENMPGPIHINYLNIDRSAWSGLIDMKFKF